MIRFTIYPNLVTLIKMNITMLSVQYSFANNYDEQSNKGLKDVGINKQANKVAKIFGYDRESPAEDLKKDYLGNKSKVSL